MSLHSNEPSRLGKQASGLFTSAAALMATAALMAAAAHLHGIMPINLTGPAPYDAGSAPYDTGSAPYDTGSAPYDRT